MPRPPTFRTLLILSLSGFLGGAACFWHDRPRIARQGGRDGRNRSGCPGGQGLAEGQGLGLDLGQGRRGRLAQRLTDAEPGRGAQAGDARRGLRPGPDVQPAELQVARAQPRRDHHLPQPGRNSPDAGRRRTAAGQERGPGLLAFRCAVHLRQRGHPDRRPGAHHRRTRRPLVQRLQGIGLGGRLGPSQVRCIDHSADRRSRRADRRGRLQEGRRPARPHASSRPRTFRTRWPGKG